MEMAKVTSKGQITIPISIRRRLEINEGDKILFINRSEGVMMVNPDVLQSGQVDELTQSEPVVEKKQKGKASPKVVAADTETVPQSQPEVAPQDASDQTPTAQTPAPVPAKEQEAHRSAPSPAQPAKQVDGLDLGSLLDDIRSIGSNI